MTTLVRTRTRITPWDDAAFARAFEHARDVATREQGLYGPAAAGMVQQLLRDAGYPMARVDVVRTAAEALEQVSHWVVTRDA